MDIQKQELDSGLEWPLLGLLTLYGTWCVAATLAAWYLIYTPPWAVWLSQNGLVTLYDSVVILLACVAVCVPSLPIYSHLRRAGKSEWAVPIVICAALGLWSVLGAVAVTALAS